MKQSIIDKHLFDGIGRNEICVHCKDKNNMFTNPLTPYIISDRLSEEKDRIMFIGKVARGDSFGALLDELLEDVTAFGEEFLETSSWAYYSYTKEIVTEYYGSFDKAFKHITFQIW